MGRFAELLAHEGVVEDLALRSRFGFLAVPGGHLEVGTDVVAAAPAAEAGASLYAVRQPEGLRWHVPSIEVTPEESPALAAFLDHVDVAVALHGYGRDDMWTTLLAGGGNRPSPTTWPSTCAPRSPTATSWSTSSTPSRRSCAGCTGPTR